MNGTFAVSGEHRELVDPLYGLEVYEQVKGLKLCWEIFKGYHAKWGAMNWRKKKHIFQVIVLKDASVAT